MEKISPTFVIVGITGDLAEKKLLPALYGLAERGLLGEEMRIIGTSRRPLMNDDLLPKLGKPADDPTLRWLDSHLTTVTADPGTPEGTAALKERLRGTSGMRLFYLSIPPTTFEPVIRCMAEAGLNGDRDYLMVEKPFGDSGASARILHALTDSYYDEANIFRVDHYLAKPGVRAISESGGLILDPRNILSLDIRSDEALDIQGRADFYEQSGALRDVIQSHLLQVLALCLSAYKAHTTGAAHQDLKAEVLADLEVLNAYRAQYKGYREEAKNPDSSIETYAAIEVTSSDHDWRDVRITVRSGKALPSKRSDITVTFADHSTHVFDMNANPAHILDGYEQVLYNAAACDRSLFLSALEIDESWRIVDPILEIWGKSGAGLEYYDKGTVPDTTI